MQTKEKNLIVDLTFSFALKIIKYVEVLEQERKYIIARQLLKSGTSIGANVREAQNAESKTEFIHKMKIAAKETDETIYWLLLCQQSKNYPALNSLIRMLILFSEYFQKLFPHQKMQIKTLLKE